MKDLPFGPTAPRVTEFQIKDELDRIEGEIEPRILTFEIPVFKGAMSFDIELGVIYADLRKTVKDVNKALSYYPGVDWRAYLRRMVDHELAHKNQTEYLSERGISIEQQNEPHYRYLKEFQTDYAAPQPIRKQVYLQELRKMTAEEMEEMLKGPRVWAASVSLSREDIREIFSPYDVVERMLELKDIAEQVRTKEDIIRYAPEMKKLLGLS